MRTDTNQSLPALHDPSRDEKQEVPVHVEVEASDRAHRGLRVRTALKAGGDDDKHNHNERQVVSGARRTSAQR